MNTSEINNILRQFPEFVGTFPSNYIPQTKQRPAYFVVNTSRWSPKFEGKVQNGDHWVAIVLKTDGGGVYFDSFGMEPVNKDIVKFLSRNCPRGYRHNTQHLQNPMSGACGLYTIDFVSSHIRGVTLKEYLRDFSGNYSSNDQLVLDRVTCLSSTSPPHSKRSLKILLN